MVKTKSGDPLRSPRKKRNREKPVVHIDDFDQTAIRNTIYDKLQNKEHITLSALKEKLLEKDIFNGCKTSLWKIVQNIGFKYSKDNRRRVLMELSHIALKRIHFLQSYIHIKNEGLREFAYLDETWIFKDGTIGRSWQDDNIKSVNKTKVGGTRFIILHAGNSHGFIPSAELVFFSSKTLDSDYHGEMNQENFKHWFVHQLLLNLEKPSTIILDNASYHTTILNKAPTTATKKVEIQEWLRSNNIAYKESDLKPQLLSLVKM